MVTVTRYRSWEELEELRGLWNPLLSRSVSDTVFLTWEWIAAWWKYYGNGRRLYVLAAWEERNLVGVAPLFIDDGRQYGRAWRRLRLIGDGSHDSDYLDCFAQSGREAEVIASLVKFLKMQRSEWDWIELNGPVYGSPCLTVMAKCAQESGWTVQSEPIRCATLPLPASWDEYLRQLDPRFRTKVRSALSVIKEQVKADPEACTRQDQLEDWLPTLFELHTRRWATQAKPGVFRSEARRNFYREFSRAALSEGWLAFHRMNWGERTLTVQYGLLYRRRFHLLQEGYDPDFSTIRPGVALRAWLIRHWIQLGIKEYDFLAGVAGYKFDWGGQEKTATRLVIIRDRLSRIVALQMPRLRFQAREGAGKLVPQPVMAFRKKLISKRARQAWQPGSGRTPQPRLGFARRLAARTYASTFLGRLGRGIASSYAWSRQNGGHWLSLHSRSKPVCQIFHFHRVNDDGDPFLGGFSAHAFRAQMEHLSKHFPVLTLDQIAGGQFPKGRPYCVAVTFDDGYRDNFLCAFPILKSLAIPATVFLATGYVESGELPWYDQIRLAFKLTKRKQIALSGGGPSGKLDESPARARFSETVLRWMRGLPQAERKAAIVEVFDALHVPHQPNLPNQMLRWEDIRQMAKCGISFGAHTVTHPVLSRCSGKEVRKEVFESKQAIENRLQTPVVHFAYPFGQTQDYSLQAKQIVREAGFKTAVTTVWGVNEPDSDPFELRRFAPWDSDPAEFQLRFDWYRLRELQPSRVLDRGNEEMLRSGEVLLG
jgi:peptidoglycan/xylan/chitin deacetylase (PgdA/CDA1 family)/CelD/BcsL family acetyltransferase involved in cellulose biosynthesis